jgi:hypothetical protein
VSPNKILYGMIGLHAVYLFNTQRHGQVVLNASK